MNFEIVLERALRFGLVLDHVMRLINDQDTPDPGIKLLWLANQAIKAKFWTIKVLIPVADGSTG